MAHRALAADTTAKNATIKGLDEDWREVSNWLSQITQLNTTHQHNKYEWKHFMVEFLRRMDARTRKDWSYKGLLPIRCPTDYITKDPRCTEFDPRNCCYAVVIMREVPSLPEDGVDRRCKQGVMRRLHRIIDGSGVRGTSPKRSRIGGVGK